MNASSPLFQPSLTAWAIEEVSLGSQASQRIPAITYGNTTLQIDRIAFCRLRREQDWDISGQHFNFMLYVGFAAFFLFLVVEAGWRWQFLAAVVLFFGIAAMSLGDVFTTKKIGYFRVEMQTVDGQAHAYTTASRPDADALIAAMVEAGVRVVR